MKKLFAQLMALLIFVQAVTALSVVVPISQGQFDYVYDFLFNSGWLGITVIFLIVSLVVEVSFPPVREKIINLIDDKDDEK